MEKTKTKKKTKLSAKMSDKELKQLDNYMKKAIADVGLAIFKALMLMAADDGIKMTSLVFERKGDKIAMRLHIGQIEYIDGDGKKHYIDPSKVKSIEYVGGDVDEEED